MANKAYSDDSITTHFSASIDTLPSTSCQKYPRSFNNFSGGLLLCDVQGTNDSSVVSKVSAAARSYFQDVFLQHFVWKVARRAPLINRSAGSHILAAYCSTLFNIESGKGEALYLIRHPPFFLLDSSFGRRVRLHADEALDGAVVFEVDFPDVARHKAALIRRFLKCTSAPVSSGPVYVSSGHYHLLGVDVREESRVEEALGAAGLDWAAPTLILSEVVLTYMETQWSDAVISWVAKLLPQSLFAMYEQIQPRDPFGRIMQDHFLKLKSNPGPPRSTWSSRLRGRRPGKALCRSHSFSCLFSYLYLLYNKALSFSFFFAGKSFLFVFGGKTESEAALGDGYFLLYSVPGGLSWDRIELRPSPVPSVLLCFRYSHSAHMIGENLVVVGGVWLHSDGVPGVMMIDLATRSTLEFSLDTTSVPWPLMLHSFCSELTESEEPELLLMGGGGNCFSFGTHFNLQPVTMDLRPALG
uniref:tRNA wybutosine-synthesizing protein 4 n=1 Tax=Cyclopterus lumpus TaxID=8103 RepID=A0A8C3A6D3_CYCLU